MMNVQTRLTRLRETFKSAGIQGFYTEDPINIFYLTGFFALESALVVAPDTAVFITDFRMLEEAANRLQGLILAEVDQGAGTVGEACRRVDSIGIERLGFESHLLSFDTGSVLVEILGSHRAIPAPGTVERLRARKDEEEIRGLEKALGVAEKAFQAWRLEVRPGMTEKEIADRLEGWIRRSGAQKGAFDHCVLVGERASLPHGEPTPGRTLGEGEALLVDFGAFVDRYPCDLTRMLYAGPPDPQIAKIHKIVEGAQKKAFETIRPGVRADEVDRAARRFIEEAGFGHAFRHGLGHGVGLQVHEAPRISWLNDARLEPGMVFTVEPGIYLPGLLGVRIEDMVLVTPEGMRKLSSLPSSIEASIL